MRIADWQIFEPYCSTQPFWYIPGINLEPQGLHGRMVGQTYMDIHMYIQAEAARLRQASTATAPRKKRNTHDVIPMMALPQ